VGEVVHIKEAGGDEGKQKSMEDHVTIKTGESRVVVERGRIARVAGSTTAGATA
jgi:preprotein translocase subunit YajC